MADSTLLNLTQAYSDDLTTVESFSFLAMLGDGTPVHAPATILQFGDSGDAPYFRSVTDRTYRTDAVRQSIVIDSPFDDIKSWWNSNSADYVRVPDDEYESILISMNALWTVNSDTSGVALRQIGVRYTVTTSDKYGQQFPRIWGSSLFVNRAALQDERMNGTDWSFGRHTMLSLPIHVESGDQLEPYANITGTYSPALHDFWLQIIPYKRRRQ